MAVNENNTLEITDSIDAYFNRSKYGIIRNMLLQKKVIHLDGTSSNNKISVENIRVNVSSSTSVFVEN